MANNSFPAKTQIIKKGETSECVYFILKGNVNYIKS